MKSYTDLNQSKKLAEILPLKSADMRFCFSHTLGGRITGHYPMIGSEPSLGTVPCWSLSALLNVLPVSCDDGQHCLALINHNPNEKTEWLCAYEDDKGNLMMECYADNQIDACVAMIEKLHEQNLL